MREIYRILDANFNRAREALRVAEDCGRFAMNDPAITAMAKCMRSDLQEVLKAMPVAEMLTSRDTPGDIGTGISSPTEPVREDFSSVVVAACKRLSEALRSIEEYSKIVAPSQTAQVERMRYNGYTLEQRLMGKLLTRRRFADVRLYALISSGLCKGSVREIARAAIAGGADAIQLREKEVPDAQLLALAAELRELTDEMGRMLIINDRADVASIVGADGVHLGQGDLPVAEVRRLLRPDAVVGRSTHSIEQAKAAVNEGVDYISVGPMFPTRTKDRPPVGVGLLKEAVAAITIPIVAIGGINASNAGELVAAGAKCLAVSSAICCAKDPRAAAEEIKKHLPPCS
ncbi:MAG: thiamine phosphate synthase [Phycisphaerae bacterium]